MYELTSSISNTWRRPKDASTEIWKYHNEDEDNSSNTQNALKISFSCYLPVHVSYLLFYFPLYILLRNCFIYYVSIKRIVFVHTPPTCMQNFLSLFWNVLFSFYCFILSRYLINFLSFAYIFWFISSSCVVRLVCICILGSSLSLRFLYLSPFLNSFACCCSFLVVFLSLFPIQEMLIL